MENVEGKYALELNFVGDGRLFLNFWDWAHGNDVVAEIKEGNLFLSNVDETEAEIDFNKFVELVKQSILKRTV